MRPKDLQAKDLFVLSLAYDFGKGQNKAVTVPQQFIGRMKGESLIEAPNVILWLGLLLNEQYGIGLQELKREKDANTKLWNTIKSCYMFPGDRKSPTYTGEHGNKHLREVMTFCGFGARIVGSVVVHSSLRGGASNEAEKNMQKGEACTCTPLFAVCLRCLTQILLHIMLL